MPIRLRRRVSAPACGVEELLRLVSDEPPAGAEVAVEARDTAAPEPVLGPPFLSLRESADWLSVSIATLKRLVAKGELQTVPVGARRKIPASHLAAYVAKDILLPEQVLSSPELDKAIGFHKSK
jgi:excisionase family DNA binding protein